MRMKKKLIFIIAAVLIIGIAAAAVIIFSQPVEDESLPSMPKSDLAYSDQLDINSPEGLAYSSTTLFKQMLAGEITAAEMTDGLFALSPSETKEKLEKEKNKFILNVKATKDALKDNPLIKFEFGKTEYEREDYAKIPRIQYHKSGLKFYYIQYFIKKDGIWRIQSDLPENPFRLK
jgi:hypothetical protein